MLEEMSTNGGGYVYLYFWCILLSSTN
jgi:hypothetical protein